ncbi:MAG: NYN domain-containing protein [Phycisphaeraceae bacterium]|nr:NYN domain-containing protein [Phycisphaeraceae bacterium]
MLLIDTYNVLWLSAALDPRAPELTPVGLLRAIAHSRYRRHPVRMVCDGHPATGEGIPANSYGETVFTVRLGPAEVIYSGRSGSADDVIERIIDAHTAPRDLVVVSSDRRIKRAATRKRSRSIASNVFLAQVMADRTRAPMPAIPAFVQEIPLSSSAVDLWRIEFGLPRESDASLLESLTPNHPHLSLPPPPTAPATRPPAPHRVSKPRQQTPTPRAVPPEPDQELMQLAEEWGLTLDLDDLDTGRWLGQ